MLGKWERWERGEKWREGWGVEGIEDEVVARGGVTGWDLWDLWLVVGGW